MIINNIKYKLVSLCYYFCQEKKFDVKSFEVFLNVICYSEFLTIFMTQQILEEDFLLSLFLSLDFDLADKRRRIDIEAQRKNAKNTNL
jgi:hypothetical protein